MSGAHQKKAGRPVVGTPPRADGREHTPPRASTSTSSSDRCPNNGRRQRRRAQPDAAEFRLERLGDVGRHASVQDAVPLMRRRADRRWFDPRARPRDGPRPSRPSEVSCSSELG